MQGVALAVHHLTSPGDGVVVHTPAYPPFLAADPRDRATLVEIPAVSTVERVRVGLRRARRATRPAPERHVPRLWILCHPQNPTGGSSHAPSWSGSPRSPRGTISSSSATRSTPSSSTPATITCRSPALGPSVAARTVTVTSASKAFNLAGLRWAILHAGHKPFHDAIAALPSHYLGTPNLLAVEATDAAWSESDEWLTAVRGLLDRNRRCLAELLAGNLPEIDYQPSGSDVPGVARLPPAGPRRRSGSDVPRARCRAGGGSPLRRRRRRIRPSQLRDQPGRARRHRRADGPAVGGAVRRPRSGRPRSISRAGRPPVRIPGRWPPSLGYGWNGIKPSAGIVPRRPAWKSSNAWASSSRVFITNGP